MKYKGLVSDELDTHCQVVQAVNFKILQTLDKFHKYDLIDAKNTNGETALMFLLGNSETKIKLLLDKGANPNCKDNKGNTALIQAISSKHIGENIVKLLCNAQYKTDLNLRDDKGNTALIIAAIHHISTEKINILLSHKADPNLANNEGCAPLIYAATYNHTNSVKMLLEYGANPNTTNAHGNTPLVWAAHHSNIEMADLLFKKGAKLNIQDNDKDTALTSAIQDGSSLVMIKWLVDHGADTAIRNNEGKTALDLARTQENPDQQQIIDLLQQLTVTDADLQNNNILTSMDLDTNGLGLIDVNTLGESSTSEL